MKKLYIILFIILNTIMNGSAQELTGQLKDSISEEPIADVLIKIDDTEIQIDQFANCFRYSRTSGECGFFETFIGDRF